MIINSSSSINDELDGIVKVKEVLENQLKQYIHIDCETSLNDNIESENKLIIENLLSCVGTDLWMDSIMNDIAVQRVLTFFIFPSCPSIKEQNVKLKFLRDSIIRLYFFKIRTFVHNLVDLALLNSNSMDILTEESQLTDINDLLHIIEVCDPHAPITNDSFAMIKKVQQNRNIKKISMKVPISEIETIKRISELDYKMTTISIEDSSILSSSVTTPNSLRTTNTSKYSKEHCLHSNNRISKYNRSSDIHSLNLFNTLSNCSETSLYQITPKKQTNLTKLLTSKRRTYILESAIKGKSLINKSSPIQSLLPAFQFSGSKLQKQYPVAFDCSIEKSAIKSPLADCIQRELTKPIGLRSTKFRRLTETSVTGTRLNFFSDLSDEVKTPSSILKDRSHQIFVPNTSLMLNLEEYNNINSSFFS